MLNEHEREDGPEEGEYHFSDEGGYETNMEEDEGKAPSLGPEGGLAAKFSAYRRFVIIGGLFAVVLLVAYLMVPSFNTTPSTEIVATNAPPVEVPQAAPTPAPTPIASPAPSSKPMVTETHQPGSFSRLIEAEKEKLAAEKNKMMAHMSNQAAPPPSNLTAPSMQITSPAEQPGPSEPQATVTTMAGPGDITQDLLSGGSMLNSAQAAREAAENKAIIERLTALQEANTRIIGQMQAEYTQKLADYEVRDKALQEQVQALNTRLTAMQAEMNKMVHAVTRQPPPAPRESSSASNSVSVNVSENSGFNLPGSPPSAPSGLSGFKSAYTVQAIIPGRAWLRNEQGETITVAEGDMIKSLGRVTKIDPYDGTILVDTGSRVVALTYGNGEFA